jgi:hypothetical protein
MGRVFRREDEVARRRLDPLTADEEGDLTRDHVEGLVLSVVDVERRSAAAPVSAEELEETAHRLLRSDLGRVPADLRLVGPPDVNQPAVLGQHVARFESSLGLSHRRSLVALAFSRQRGQPM